MSRSNSCMQLTMNVSKLFYVMALFLSVMCGNARYSAKTILSEKEQELKCHYAVENEILDSEIKLEILCMPEKWWEFTVENNESIILDEILDRDTIIAYYDSYVEMSYILKDLSSDFIMLVNAVVIAESQIPKDFKDIVMPIVGYFAKFDQEDYYCFIDLINCLVFTAFHAPDIADEVQKELIAQRNGA
ncbi:hypothetical protein HK407_01g00750 [Ordospora pajunii]|uniref:uncharacterized protein n=1 Tax=Ordospora pajunii TaxID=3039483 RepID=UPI00295289A5|nr:uncharacterized protein HK407_01g00750 [Ordospora pajunii]KAH9412182.1 hypothetical protein HK407_01g00750 [Ordospora pajunii]